MSKKGRLDLPNKKVTYPNGSYVILYLSHCKKCNTERWVRFKDINLNCKKCTLKKTDIKSDDYIIVEHKAGNRKPQKVKKLRDFCPTCKKDKGYIFNSLVGFDCSSCARKKSYQKGTKINDNLKHIRNYHNTPFQGEVCVRSSYESFYIEYLNQNRIPYYYEKERLILSDESTYLPDFYLPESNTFIEIKGFVDDNKMEKAEKEFKQYKFKKLRLDDLKKIGYKPNLYKNRFNFVVNSDKWVCFLLSNKEYEKKFGSDSQAITVVENKTIYFQPKYLNFEVINHEINHVYFSYLCLNSVDNLKIEDIEEINSEFLANNVFKLLNTSFIVYKNLRTIMNIRFKKDIQDEYSDLDDSIIKSYLVLLRGLNWVSDTNENFVDILKQLTKFSDRENT